MKEKRYTEDKPKECRFCYFWSSRQKKCELGEDKCYYLIEESDIPASPCTDCPYGKHQSCLGWCTKKLLERNKENTGEAT